MAGIVSFPRFSMCFVYFLLRPHDVTISRRSKHPHHDSVIVRLFPAGINATGAALPRHAEEVPVERGGGDRFGAHREATRWCKFVKKTPPSFGVGIASPLLPSSAVLRHLASSPFSHRLVSFFIAPSRFFARRDRLLGSTRRWSTPRGSPAPTSTFTAPGCSAEGSRRYRPITKRWRGG